MTPDEAALCLRDIPNFATYPEEEQREEAMTLLGHDDPLDVALAIEGALMPVQPRETVAAMGLGGEDCRLSVDCGGREPMAGNGRCLTCGAYRAPVEAQERSEEGEAIPTPLAPSDALRRAHAETVGLIERFKAVTGERDEVIGELIGLKRSTVSAYATGRLPERLDREQLMALHLDLLKRASTVTALAAEIRKPLSETGNHG